MLAGEVRIWQRFAKEDGIDKKKTHLDIAVLIDENCPQMRVKFLSSFPSLPCCDAII
jgi:hypothetical protein